MICTRGSNRRHREIETCENQEANDARNRRGLGQRRERRRRQGTGFWRLSQNPYDAARGAVKRRRPRSSSATWLRRAAGSPAQRRRHPGTPDSAQLAATPSPSDQRPERCRHEKMEAPRNKLCCHQENSAPRNGGAGTLRVTPAGGVPKDNIRFGATNCVVTEKMSTLGKERFCDREIRCNTCCDRNPPPGSALLAKEPTKRWVLPP